MSDNNKTKLGEIARSEAEVESTKTDVESTKTEANKPKTEDNKPKTEADAAKTEAKSAETEADKPKKAKKEADKLKSRPKGTAPNPRPGGLFGYKSMSEKSIQKTVDLHTTMLMSCVIICTLSLVLGIINLCLVKDLSANPVQTTLDEWVECELENHVGYKVRKDWKTSGYNDSVIFQPSETTAIAVGAQSVADINRANTGNKLTHDTLRQYIEDDLKAINKEAGYSVENVAYEEFVVLGTTGYRYTFNQKTPTNNQTVSTYTDSVFFIYEGYLYTFSFTSAVSGYSIPEFTYVLDSIRLIPASERPTLLPSDEFNKSLVDDYASLGSDITSSNTSSEASK